MAEKTRMQMLQEMLAKEPRDSFLNYGLALEYVSAGRLEDAAAQFEKLVKEVDPEYSAGWFQYGRTLEKLNRTDRAREVLTRGIAVAEKQGDWHTAGEMREALAELD